MVISEDLRWRAISLYSIQSVPLEDVATLLSISASSIRKWITIFNKTGGVADCRSKLHRSRWPSEVLDYVREYVKEHPCFLLEELQENLQETFPSLKNISLPTICRALRHDLNMTRKRLQKRARESKPQEISDYKYRLNPFYQYKEQLVFVDEVSKDGRAALRQYAWSTRGTPAVVSLPFSRGIRVSALAAFNSKGFLGWKFTRGTFTRFSFHKAFKKKSFLFSIHTLYPTLLLL